MNFIEKYFRKFTDKLSYIELKNKKNKYQKLGSIPLPIILDDMIDGISTAKFDKEVEIRYILDGILFNLAIDPEFLYINDYKKILKDFIDNPSNYSLKKAIENLEKDKFKALIYARAAFLLDEKNEFAGYNYASLLKDINLKSDNAYLFIQESVRILQRILSYNNKNALVNYEMGNISYINSEFIKADSYYKRALINSDNEELKNIIRIRLDDIAPEVSVENSIYYINKMNYSKAIELLLEAKKNSNRYDIPYYMAVSYMNLEKLDLAEKYFEESISKGADFATLYTDLVYIKYLMNKSQEALEISNQALEKYPSDLKLRYNRAVINISLNKNEKAIEDLDFILEYQDLSDEFFNQIMKLRTSLEV